MSALIFNWCILPGWQESSQIVLEKTILFPILNSHIFFGPYTESTSSLPMQAALHASDSNKEPPKLTFVVCTPVPNLEACALAGYYQTLTHPAGGPASFK